MFFLSSRRRHTRLVSDWSSDVCSSDLLGVERNELAFPGKHAGIDLEKRGIGIDEGAIESLEEWRGVVDHFDRQAQAESNLAGLIRLQANCRMNGFAQNGAGIFLGDFLDLHAASSAGHEHDAAGGAIDEEAEIKVG